MFITSDFKPWGKNDILLGSDVEIFRNMQAVFAFYLDN
jgi:hypothetical protein